MNSICGGLRRGMVLGLAVLGLGGAVAGAQAVSAGVGDAVAVGSAGVWSGAERLDIGREVAVMKAAEASAAAGGGGGGADAAKLALKLSNPVANLISIPFQFNYDEGFGPKDAGYWKLNVQPVVPITLNENWNVISRTILPVLYQESPADGVSSEFGLGDTTQSFFLSPVKGDLIWGVGPAFLIPTGTDETLSSEKWGAGPTAVVLKQFDGWTVGCLANHIWSFAGQSDRDYVSSTFIQPFVSYTTKTALSFTLNSESTYNWHDNDATIPINFVVGQVVRLGRLPVQFSIGARYYAESPDNGPEWGGRFAVTILLPK